MEELRVSLLNSKRWRRFAKHGLGAQVFHSRAFRKVDLARRYMTSYWQSRRRPALFDEVHTFCMFVGHAKSGGTMIGSLLDAHPDVILADETNVKRYISAGFRQAQIYHILLKGSRREALKGRVTARRLTPYSFAVPGQWQGGYRHLRVIGHSRAGPSTGQLSRDPALLADLRRVMRGVDVRIIHVIRNPYDPISLMMIRGKRSFANAVNHYFDYCQTLTALRQQLDESEFLAVRYEDFVERPREHLDTICHFLGVEAANDYLDACASILYDSPERSRQLVAWDEKWVDIVQRRIDEVDFLSGYAYDDLSQEPARSEIEILSG